MYGDRLQTPIQYLKGVGPKLAKILSRLGINTIEDLIYFIPRSYEDRRNVTPIKNLKTGEMAVVNAEIVDISLQQTYRRFSVLTMTLADKTGKIKAVWFNQPFLLKLFRNGMRLIVFGKVEINTYNDQRQISVREFDIDTGDLPQIIPIYPLTEGIFPKKMRSLIKAALDNYLKYIIDQIPAEITKEHKLLNLLEAIKGLHFPTDFNKIEAYRNRLIFDELFIFQLGLGLRRKEFKEEKGIVFNIDEEKINEFESSLPFTLTQAQREVLNEIKADFASGKPMHRLLQGDVGSGKTIVAVEAALCAIHSGYQVAIMAPTEILAQQHFSKISKLLKPLKVKIKLLTSSTSSKQNAEHRAQSAGIVIGTHALIEGKIQFEKLGLVIIDEQHRFGVMQRAALVEKGQFPHILVMTATPIPRSLALILYGDLDRSIISEMPPGRTPIETHFVTEAKRKSAYQFIRERINEKQQVFVVCPLVEESEELDLKAAKEEADRLQAEVFADYKVGLIHGRMKGAEKDAIMKAFKQKKLHILVSTTVIEVGIDIPNASVMMIEHVERFGLSQLHQLRGRIGRGAAKSYCLLFGKPKTDEAKARIKAMLETCDGFKIAEADLKLRGPGEFFGTRQSGLPNFRVADIIKDEKILQLARRAAFELIQKDYLVARNLWDSQGKEIKSS